MNNTVRILEKGKPTEEAKTFCNQELVIAPFGLNTLSSMLTKTQNFIKCKR
ncbi:hypothetical protein [Candidatus Williamhamiltonella defendens]|uniref:hypothetical protein n=1 Tax=Candidatus Williamhamiltonella defendens TaxID=138072 RepID=UPI00165196C4|nr:hypothetical protein [Candidatus Hamiltonella defensa]